MKKTPLDNTCGRILVIGASGMVGHKIWQLLGNHFSDVVGTVRRARETYISNPFFAKHATAQNLVDRVDLWNPDSISPILDELRPAIIINCAALTFRRENSESVEDNIRLNALLPHVLARWAEKNQSYLITFSTDCVFSGLKGNYTEDSIPDATDAYGRSKALGEVRSSRTLVLRTSVIGREIDYRTQLVEWFLAQRAPKIFGYSRAVFSGVTTLFLSELVLELIRRRNGGAALNGIYNLASTPISKHDLLQKLKEYYRVDIEIVPDDQKVVSKDLDGSRFVRETGIVVPSWDEMIAKMAGDEEFYAPVTRKK